MKGDLYSIYGVIATSTDKVFTFETCFPVTKRTSELLIF